MFCQSGNIESSAVVSGYNRYSIQYSIDFIVNNALTAGSTYYFNNAIAILNTPVVSDSITVLNADLSGTGSLQSSGVFDWTNGKIDLPIELTSTGICKISTDSYVNFIFYQ
jgi:hypothetical protein